MFNPRPRIESVTIAPGHVALVIDDALADPQRWVDLAAHERAAFVDSPHNAYPGPELRMPDEVSTRLDAFFTEHIRARLGGRRTLRRYSRLSIATRAAQALEPRQWICHRDRIDEDPDRCVAACVLYLFRDERLGGTAFFAPLRGARETAVLIHESGTLDAAGFTHKYAIAATYPHAGNRWFEKTAAIPAKWNRLIFYDGGAVFHGSDIDAAERLSDDPRSGRLTLNGFFVCRKAAR